MALTFTVLDSGYVQENLGTYNTNAGVGLTHIVGDGLVTMTANRLYYVVIACDRGGGGTTTSITQDPDGTPLALAIVTDATQATPVGDGRIEVWKVVPGSTTADAIIRFVLNASHSQLIWAVIEVTGFDISGTEVQVVKTNGTASPATVTMAAYGATDNAILSVVGLAEFATGETITGEHTELADIDDNERMQLMVQVNNPHASDTTPSATYTEPGSEEHAIIGIEIKAAVGGGGGEVVGSPVRMFSRGGSIRATQGRIRLT